MIELIAGMAFGLTGLVPFIHANTVIELTSGFFSGKALQWFAIVLIFARLPFEFIASAKFFTAGEHGLFSLHPFQKLGARGESGKALKIALKHCAAGIATALILFPIVSTAAPTASSAIKPFSGVIVAAIFLTFLMLSKNKIDAFLLAALTGALGLILLEKNFAYNTLFFMLSGLFAVPVLFQEAKNIKIVEQKANEVKAKFEPVLGIAGGAIALAASFFPAISLTVLTALAFLFFESKKEEDFIALNSALIGGRAVSDFAALQFLGKARSGAAAIIMENSSAYPFSTALAQLLVGSCIFLVLSLVAWHVFNSINFSWLEKKHVRLAAIGTLFLYAFISAGAGGIIVLGASSLVGLTALSFQCGRAVLSSCIVLPVVKNTLT